MATNERHMEVLQFWAPLKPPCLSPLTMTPRVNTEPFFSPNVLLLAGFKSFLKSVHWFSRFMLKQERLVTATFMMSMTTFCRICLKSRVNSGTFLLFLRPIFKTSPWHIPRSPMPFISTNGSILCYSLEKMARFLGTSLSLMTEPFLGGAMVVRALMLSCWTRLLQQPLNRPRSFKHSTRSIDRSEWPLSGPLFNKWDMYSKSQLHFA